MLKTIPQLLMKIVVGLLTYATTLWVMVALGLYVVDVRPVVGGKRG